MDVVDSHTGGEPTRLIIRGGPDLGSGSLAERRAVFARDFDHVRRRCINEPRGSDFLVGGLLCEPIDPNCTAGVIFFNNVGMLHMCGHGTMGVAATLVHLGRIGPGLHKLETPVGVVTMEVHDANRVTIQNVPSWRYREAVSVDVPERGQVTGDIVWGGNWFFCCNEPPCELVRSNVRELTDAAEAVKAALVAQGITGAQHGEIDHIDFFGPGQTDGADSRNFVLCPGGAYDRSPCGTGTSAKLATLAASGALEPGVTWVQESIIGSRFEGHYRLASQAEAASVMASNGSPVIIPSITGRAFITGEATIISQEGDPFANGIV